MISVSSSKMVTNSSTKMQSQLQTQMQVQIDYESFMEMYRISKEEAATKEISNARITDEKNNAKGGRFSIPESEYTKFLDVYFRDVVKRGQKETITELQLVDDGPCLVDLDFRFPYECTTRTYTQENVEDFIGVYLEELKRIFHFDADSQFNIYVLEKPAINRVKDKNITKDGIHIVLGIKSERKMQTILRRRVIKSLQTLYADTSVFPITNTWEDVVDLSVASGKSGWQLYGSSKPGCDSYRLTTIYEVGFDTVDGEMTISPIPADTLSDEEWAQTFPKMSARYTKHPQFFYKTEFARELAAEPDSKRQTAATNLSAMVGTQNGPTNLFNNNDNLYILSISSQQMLDQVMTEFYESIADNHELRDIYNYAMALPESYYGPGSYTKWLRVGWALRNSNNRLLIVWLALSSKSSQFSFVTDVADLYERWSKFDMNNPSGLTKRSIMYWCRADNPEMYREIRKSSTEYLLDRTLGAYEDLDESVKLDKKGTTDYDIASILHHMYKDTYVCASFTNNIWFRYVEPRWKKIDAGTQLRMVISTELRRMYAAKVAQCMEQRNQMNEIEDEYKIKKITKFIDKLLGVCTRLGQSSDKKNIMTEAKELFLDESFTRKLDTNPYLLCFNNGVVDFKTKTFRRGMPEDYITKCTNIDYIPIDEERDAPIMGEIRKFMRELFPEADIHDYMWEYLASTLIGVLPDQTWNMFIGEGQNGKSLLMTTLGHVLGEYKVTVATNLITDKRTKIGGTNTELLTLKAARFALMQEPEKGAQVNEGVMKQLTSGLDTIEARGLYCSEMDVFMPQFKLGLCSNYLMKIVSNDHGTWRRIRVVPFKSRFTKDPVTDDPDQPYQFQIDYTLEERCVVWKVVFASMLVNIAFVTQGKVKDCEAVLAASNSYRESQDYIAEFISDRLVIDPSGVVSKVEISQEFKVWYDSTYGRGAPNVKEVQAYMDKKFKKCASRKVWVGARMNYDMGASYVNDEYQSTMTGVSSNEL